MNVISTLLLASVLIPSKGWFAPDQPIAVQVKPSGEVTLVLTDFSGQNIDSTGPAIIKADKTVDLKQLFPLSNPGTYILYAVPKGADTGAGAGGASGGLKEFEGTPLVVDVRPDKRIGAPPGPMVVRVQPLVFAQMTTDKGKMTIVFYFDAAPNTAEHFIALAREGFYDALSFHRIVPGFVIQGGDPRGDGTGGPGYQIQAEFNDRPHEAGVLSMARQGDPNEPSAMPRCEFANSAGSQFFICLDYTNTKQLDGRYTAFAKVVEGMETVRAIAGVPIGNPDTGRPTNPPKITGVKILAVTAKENPYAKLIETEGAATRPAESK